MDELNSKYPRVREAAVQALGAIASAKDRSLAALKKAMTDPRPFVRGAAAESCVTFGVKTTPLVPDLIQLISDDYLEVRLASISALAGR